MNNLISISNVKDNVLEFNVIVDNINQDNINVRFIIESSMMDLTFDSIPGDEENQWSVKIPALSMLETTSYPFRIDVIIDEYFFNAMKGSVNVVGSHDIYASKPENITLSPSKKKAKVKEIIKKAENKKAEEPKKVEPKKIEVKKEELKKVEKVVEPEEKTVKPNRKFEMTPLKVKDSGELFKSLTANKTPIRKTDDKLDDKIMGLLKKAKDDKKLAAEKELVKKEMAKKKTKPVVKKATPKKKKIAVAAPKKETKPVAKKATTKKKETKSSAKNIAEKIIQTVTGLGGKKEDAVETSDDKIKKIITEDAGSNIKRKPGRPRKVVAQKKEPSAIKKIAKDNTITEIDKSKDQSIKDALKEVDESDNKTVTTKPLKKKDITFH